MEPSKKDESRAAAADNAFMASHEMKVRAAAAAQPTHAAGVHLELNDQTLQRLTSPLPRLCPRHRPPVPQDAAAALKRGDVAFAAHEAADAAAYEASAAKDSLTGGTARPTPEKLERAHATEAGRVPGVSTQAAKVVGGGAEASGSSDMPGAAGAASASKDAQK